MALIGQIGGLDVKILIDTGAQSNYVDSKLVAAAKLHSTPLDVKVPIALADGSIRSITSQAVDVPIQIGKYVDYITCDILDIAQYDVILGTPWLDEKDCTIFWKKKKLVFTHNNAAVTLQITPPIRSQTTYPLLCSTQFSQ